MLTPLPKAPAHFQLFLVVPLASSGSSHLPGRTLVKLDHLSPYSGGGTVWYELLL